MGWSALLRTPRFQSLPDDSAVRVYVRIMAAAEAGKGLRITPDQAFALSLDNAIAAAAVSFADEDEP